MKTVLFSLSLFIMATGGISAQNCSKYYPMNEGASFQYTSYNKKGKTEGIADYKVTDVSMNGGATQATMTIELKDEKGKEIYNTSYTFSCADNKVTIDYESLMSEDMMKQMGDMEMEITGTDIELPNDLVVGQALSDANVAMKIDMGGMTMNMRVDMVNRKVEKQESVTTPAGTFNCYVIYSDNQSKMMMVNQSFPSRQWLAEGVGMIKQETYNKKGQLMGSSILTKFSK
jgi:hypothetical protein